MTDFLQEKTREIAQRLDELRPLVEEFKRLEAAQRALEGVVDEPVRVGGNGGGGPRRQSSPARPGGSGGGGGVQRGRPRGSGTRANEALDIIKANPGITIPELAENMGIKQNYLYRVIPGLEQDGLVRKEGRGWHPEVTA